MVGDLNLEAKIRKFTDIYIKKEEKITIGTFIRHRNVQNIPNIWQIQQ